MKNLRYPEVKAIKDLIVKFLSGYGMYYGDIDIQKHVDFFIQEMKDGLEGRKSSLKMIPTFIEYQSQLPEKEPVVVIDAGGTNLRSALVLFDKDKKLVIKNFKVSVMPGIDKEVSKDEFFEAIAASIKDIIGLSDKIGFVFSYAVKMFPDKDGMLIRFTKEIKAREVEGQFIGKNLIDKLKEYGISGKRVVILNDAVASLLAGMSAFPERQYSSFVGLILGTGMNASYIEKNSEIKNSDVSSLNSDGYQIINMEAGNFGKGQRGEIDLEFNRKTLEPDQNIYEKMFSGAYLGGIAGEVVKFALRDGIFSEGFSKVFGDTSTIILESKDIDDYLNFLPEGANMSGLFKAMDNEDRIKLYYIFDNLIERAAMFVSVVLSSAVIKPSETTDPCYPVCITAEGSSFYKMKNFYSRVDRYMQKILGQRGIYHYEINRVENAILCGAAMAGLVGCEKIKTGAF